VNFTEQFICLLFLGTGFVGYVFLLGFFVIFVY